MSHIELVVDQLRRAYDGEAWHGPALMETLEGIDANTAAARPVATAHTIWELVLHITAWEGVVARRVQGEDLTLSDEENFGRISSQTDTTWREAVDKLRSTHEQLIKLVSSLSESELNKTVPGKDYDLLSMLLGTVQHAAYHGGQIALLKKAGK